MRTSTAVVRSSLVMLPRLQAEESILFANRTAVGSGALSKDDARAVTSKWAKAAAAEIPVLRNPSQEDLNALGISVKKVKRRGH